MWHTPTMSDGDLFQACFEFLARDNRIRAGKMGSDHDFRLHSSYGRGLARDQAFVATRRLIAGEPARAALSEAFR